MTLVSRPFFAAVLAAFAIAPRVDAAPVPAVVTNPLLTPPGTPPVEVRTGFYLLNLASISERTESFEADVYLQFTWSDPRLAFTPKRGGEIRHMLGEGDTQDALKEIWWPQVEFVNAVSPQMKNRSLTIASDGTVTYQLGVTSQFRSRYDFRRFPFDSQVLNVKLQSFLYDSAAMRFVGDPTLKGFAGDDTCDDLRVTGVGTVCRTVSPPGLGETWSEFTANIHVKRNAAFYIWRVFFPTILIMAMSFTVYFIRIPELKDRASISLSCMLACIATQFAISFNIPKISYLTVVDKVYLVTYACLAVGVGVSVIEHSLHHRNHPHLNCWNRIARWLVPLVYATLIVRIIVPHA